MSICPGCGTYIYHGNAKRHHRHGSKSSAAVLPNTLIYFALRYGSISLRSLALHTCLLTLLATKGLRYLVQLDRRAILFC
jgi:hypothetical protein